MINTKTAPQQPSQKKPITGRSPAYPFMSISKAVTRAEEFRAAEGKHAVPADSAYKAWGYSGNNSSNARQTLAAMRYYGLMESTDNGNVRLTKLALDIILDQQSDSTERKNHIKHAAMMPKIHKELWDKWQDELPSDATMLTYLIRDRGFNEGAAKDLLGEYKDTLSYAKITKSDNMSEEFQTGNSQNNSDVTESQQPQTSVKHSSGAVERIFSGERSFLAGPLSSEGASYRLLVSGKVGPKELGKLIKLLTLQKELLEDESNEESD